MKLTSTQIVLYIIFIISIVLISYYYTNNTESFISNDNNVLTAEEQQIDNLLEERGIKDIKMKNKIMTNVIELQSRLKSINSLDVPISINNNGKVCDDWYMYDNGKYKDNNNNCIKINNSTERKCLSNNILASCSDYYEDGMIDNLNTFDINTLIVNFLNNIIISAQTLNDDISEYDTNITTILTNLIEKRNLEIQQLYFIDYNNKNLDDKKILFNKTNTKFEKSENEININKIQFQDFLDKKKILSKQKDTYYNYIKWLIILLLIVGFFNFMFTEII